MDLWTEKEIYNFAKKLHPPKQLPSPPTLKALCMDFTINRWEYWTDVNEELGINAFDKMAPLLRNDLIDRLSLSLSNLYDFDWTQRKFLLVLLNTQTKSLVLDRCEIHCAQTFHNESTSFLTQLVATAPNLELLAFTGLNFPLVGSFLAPNDIKTSNLSIIGQLKNLQQLYLSGNYLLNNEDFMLVTKDLKNLVKLRVVFNGRLITPVGFQNMSGLKKLEEFEFSFGWLPPKDRQLVKPLEVEVANLIYNWCAQNLLKLKQIKITANNLALLREVIPTFSGTSCLEMLSTNHFLPDANLPNLKELRIEGEIKDKDFFTKIASYQNLSNLQLNHITPDELFRILELIGTQLTSLSCVTFDPIDDSLDFFKIIYLCPNLVKLFVMVPNGSVTNSEYVKLLSSKHFRHLGNINIMASRDTVNKFVIPVEFLKLVFEAPFLKDFTLHDFAITKEGCKFFYNNMVEGRFKKLECVMLHNIKFEPGCTFKDLGLMVKSLVCGAPNLSAIHIGLRDYPANDQWAREQKCAVKLMELVSSKKIRCLHF